VNGNSIVGNAVEDDNVIDSGTSNSVGTLVGNSSFTLTRQS
jgi:hypothetical protein